MNCNEMRERINDYVDGNLAEGEREVLALHLAACAACRREEAALRRLLESAGGLDREIVPGEDLWEGISARISRRGRGEMRGHRWALAAAVAAVLVLTVAAVTASRMKPGVPAGSAVVRGGDGPDSVGALDACARTPKGLMDEIIRGVDPDIAAAVRGDLLVIESAVAEIQSALEADPGNERLRQMLVMVCEKQDGLIAQVARLAGSA